MNLGIKTLTPIYIGTGEEYNGRSYITEDDNVKFYDLRGIISTIDKMPQRDRFFALLSERRRLVDILKEVFGDDELPWLDDSCIYTLPLSDKIGGDKRIRPIRTFIGNAKNIYIPGTEIKGAIRTAILYYFLNPELHNKGDDIRSLSERFYHSLLGKINRRKSLRDIESEIEQEVFRTDRDTDGRYDVLKHLTIRDSELRPCEECLFVSNITLMNVHEHDRYRSDGRIAIPSQLCSKDTFFLSKKMRINDNQLIASELGFSDRQKWVIQYTQLLPNFFQCCYSFSKRLLEADIRYFNREDSILDTSLLMKNLDVDDESRIEPILNQIVDRLKEIQGQNSPETPLIRLGGSKGYFSNTISLILKERNPTMYEKVVSVLSRTPYKFPRTRRVVLSPDGKYDILGWIQLSRQAG